MFGEIYSISYESLYLKSLSDPDLPIINFEVESLSYDCRLVIYLLGKNLVEKNKIIATSVIDLISETGEMRSGCFKLLMWFNSKIDPNDKIHSFGN